MNLKIKISLSIIVTVVCAKAQSNKHVGIDTIVNKQGYVEEQITEKKNIYGYDTTVVLKQLGYYINNEKQGLWKSYYQGNNALESEVVYKNGHPDSIATYYYPNGNKRSIFNSSIHNKTSSLYGYLPNGTLVNGLVLKNGITTGYVKNAATGKNYAYWVIKDTVGGEVHRRYSYHMNGNLNDAAVYVNNVENGTHKQYYENGKLKVEYEVIDGKKNGFFKKYNDKGELTETLIYKNNNVIPK